MFIKKRLANKWAIPSRLRKVALCRHSSSYSRMVQKTDGGRENSAQYEWISMLLLTDNCNQSIRITLRCHMTAVDALEFREIESSLSRSKTRLISNRLQMNGNRRSCLVQDVIFMKGNVPPHFGGKVFCIFVPVLWPPRSNEKGPQQIQQCCIPAHFWKTVGSAQLCRLLHGSSLPSNPSCYLSGHAFLRVPPP